MTRRRPALLLLLTLALAVAACGVPTNARPRALPDAVVPRDLVAANPVTTSSTVPLGSTARVRVYLVGGVESERLVPVDRTVQAPADVERVLAQLALGPNREEEDRGLRSAILPGTVINSVLVESNIAIVDLAKGHSIARQGTDFILALAQMVYTATELSGVGGVRFTLDGERANVPNGTGVETAGPIGRVSYAAYAPL
ncbi:MAG: GerMN domain-containing protein [Acidimicrobiia bacterium]